MADALVAELRAVIADTDGVKHLNVSIARCPCRRNLAPTDAPKQPEPKPEPTAKQTWWQWLRSMG